MIKTFWSALKIIDIRLHIGSSGILFVSSLFMFQLPNKGTASESTIN